MGCDIVPEIERTHARKEVEAEACDDGPAEGSHTALEPITFVHVSLSAKAMISGTTLLVVKLW